MITYQYTAEILRKKNFQKYEIVTSLPPLLHTKNYFTYFIILLFCIFFVHTYTKVPNIPDFHVQSVYRISVWYTGAPIRSHIYSILSITRSTTYRTYYFSFGVSYFVYYLNGSHTLIKCNTFHFLECQNTQHHV